MTVEQNSRVSFEFSSPPAFIKSQDITHFLQGKEGLYPEEEDKYFCAQICRQREDLGKTRGNFEKEI